MKIMNHASKVTALVVAIAGQDNDYSIYDVCCKDDQTIVDNAAAFEELAYSQIDPDLTSNDTAEAVKLWADEAIRAEALAMLKTEIKNAIAAYND